MDELYKFAQFVEQRIAHGQIVFPVLVSICMGLYFFKSEISQLIGWIYSRRLSKIKNMLDSGWLDAEMSLELQEQYNQLCFQNTKKFFADKGLRLKIFSLLKQDPSLSMCSFKRAREYFNFKNNIFIFKITRWHYLITSIIMIATTILSCLWLVLCFLFFIDVNVSAMQWVVRIFLLMYLGFLDSILFRELYKFLEARILSLKINNQAMPSIPQFWLNQLNAIFMLLKFRK